MGGIPIAAPGRCAIADGGDRAGSGTDDLGGNAAQQQTLDAPPTVGAHHNQVGVVPRSTLDDPGGRLSREDLTCRPWSRRQECPHLVVCRLQEGLSKGGDIVHVAFNTDRERFLTIWTRWSAA